ncbi:MFS transporter [Actinospica durhamensis]|uniref:MFS transporter n=1 Tax=Actinospica durhamensis TaxID=1508375 RepID=A0A941IS07_9ACTN|nr:MFS transporter [Actinospica durhamensis]MBR7839400.1 MFS transporter [Actinospica durhamensis]
MTTTDQCSDRREAPADATATHAPAPTTATATAAATVTATATATDRRHNSPFTLFVLLIGVFMALLDFFIVNVALPSAQKELHASSAGIQWVVAAYGIALAAGLISGGRIGDLFGRKQSFILGMLLFTLASVGCGIAPSVGVLITARAVQGLAAAVFLPQILGIIGAAFSGPARVRAFNGYGLTAGLGAVFGQLIGGALIQANLFDLGWRLVFWINVPIGAAAIVLALRALPDVRGGARTRLDPVGTGLLGAAVLALILPLVEGRTDGWPAWTWTSLAACPALLVLFYLHQRRLIARGGAPVLNPALFQSRAFAVGMPVALVYNLSIASFFFVLALYLQQGRGLTALDSGLLFGAVGVPYLMSSMSSGKLAARFGRSLMAVGSVVQGAGYALLALTAHQEGAGHTICWLIPGMVVVGLGMGCAYSPMFGLVLAGVDPRHASSASGLLSTVQQIGGATGIAVAGIVFFDRLGVHLDAGAFTGAFGDALILLTLVSAAAAALMLLLPDPRKAAPAVPEPSPTSAVSAASNG